MPVTTLSAAAYITPTVIKTFFEHGKRKVKTLKDGTSDEQAKDDILFDEAFHIVKAFIELGTNNTVESLQGFTNTHVPSPYWAAVSPVLVPLTSCNRAADVLIDWFGPEELHTVVGGDRWWQVRGLDGVDAEWITEKEYLSEEKVDIGGKLSSAEKDIVRMEKLESVMLYVHGGGYFWGSINTHRYQIIRYARKFQGRAFAVNYRKAPQYPWPCPLQDVLAAYFYLISPPLGALHKPISPAKIVFAGDSAGGGLCMTAMTILRDMGLPLPAGAVLISPWVDLTHSFPSVMENTETDIIPQHGFLSKPSTLWPVDPIPRKDGRATKSTTNPPPKPGHADTLRPLIPRDEERKGSNTTGQHEEVKTQAGMLNEDSGLQDEKLSVNSEKIDTITGGKRRACSAPVMPSGVENSEHASRGHPADPNGEETYDVDFWEPNPPKVLMKDPNAIPLELRAQIQLYAMTEQLTHPLVSPVLQGSLGNLPPLYIIAGNDEVLRDEIIYLAHRAAHPEEYPTRQGVLRKGHKQQENADKFRTPTKVHLQVFDDMCHVLTVFSFTSSAKYAYRSIAEFVKHVTLNSPEHLERNPFPELHRPPSVISTDSEPSSSDRRTKTKSKAKADTSGSKTKSTAQDGTHQGEQDSSDVKLYKMNRGIATDEARDDQTDVMPYSKRLNESSIVLDEDPEVHDIPNISMIRERVNIHGRVRPMESRAKLPALNICPAEVGLIKEAPTIRWLQGQEEWDKRYKRSAERAVKKRREIEAKTQRMLDNARDQGLMLFTDSQSPSMLDRRSSNVSSSHSRRTTDGAIQPERRWGPLDLAGERPPPSAIANRRDTPEAYALLRKSIYHTAPVTHKTIPRMKTMDAIRAAFDPHDDPIHPPKQSVSEQQVRTHIIPIHGLRLWDTLIGYFMRKSSKKAANGKDQAGDAIRNSGMSLGLISPSREDQEH